MCSAGSEKWEESGMLIRTIIWGYHLRYHFVVFLFEISKMDETAYNTLKKIILIIFVILF